MDRILVTFRRSKVSFDILFNYLNDIESIGALLSYSCNIRARPPNDRVVRAMVPPAPPLLQQPSDPMQVGLR